MLKAEIVAEVRALLAEGLSQRAIARRLAGRVSRGSIQNIASGKRADRPDSPDDDPPPPGPAARCGTCGRKVVLPCRACVTESLGPPRVFREDDLSGDPLGLELRPHHQANYQDLAARRGRPAA